MTADWTAEEDAALVRLWAEGGSASEIGKALGRSKNSVIGRVHRMNLPGRESPIKRAAPGSETRERIRPRAGKVTLGATPGAPLQVRNGASPASDTALPARESTQASCAAEWVVRDCQYPLWDSAKPRGELGMFCGGVLEARGDVYCAVHKALCYERVATVRRDREKDKLLNFLEQHGVVPIPQRNCGLFRGRA